MNDQQQEQCRRLIDETDGVSASQRLTVSAGDAMSVISVMVNVVMCMIQYNKSNLFLCALES